MREIKFRAWHESKNGQVMLKVGDKHGTTHPLDCCVYVINGQHVTLMQYTGLKDKNGVEIYEGDIMKSAGGRIREVYWENELSQYRFRSGADMFHADMMEVIGNIYENKELLE